MADAARRWGLKRSKTKSNRFAKAGETRKKWPAGWGGLGVEDPEASVARLDLSGCDCDATLATVEVALVSDTHGFELSPSDASLPGGDVLLHGGDFALDSGNTHRDVFS